MENATTKGVFGVVQWGNFAKKGVGGLYSFTLDSPSETMTVSTKKHLSNVTISNGICWTDTKMYFIDTALGTVDEFDFDKISGAVSNRRTCIDCKKHDVGHPDGMTMDADGRLWIAMWDGWCYLLGSNIRGTIRENYAPLCTGYLRCFWGIQSGQLYITTASCGLSEDELKTKQPQAGKLFVADFSESNIRGCKAAVFGTGLTDDRSKI